MQGDLPETLDEGESIDLRLKLLNAIPANRHTVSYRLERVRELSGLDPFTSEDRERLGLGLKAYRIIKPRLPR